MNGGGYYILDKEKNPIEVGLETWSKWYQNGFDQRRVKLTEVGNGQKVSTVFLGLDHSFDPNSKPVLFETMIYNKNDTFEDYQWRYHTWQEALINHEKIVEVILTGGNLDEYEPI